MIKTHAPTRRRDALLAALTGLIAAVASSPAQAVTLPPPPGIKVFDAGSAVQLVNFRSMSCRRRNVVVGGVRFNDFRASARYGPWYLQVVLDDFGGYRKYDIPRGDGPDNLPYFVLSGPNGPFNNIAKPPQAILPPVGGALTFPGGMSRIGLGYINGWNNTVSRAVTIAGIAYCRYPVPRRR